MSFVTGENLANWLGISETQVTSFARRGVIVRAGRKGFELEASIRSYCQHLREQAVGRKAGDAPMKDRARLAKAQADSVEQKTAIRAGKLLDAEAVEAEWTGVCRTLRAGVMRIPRRAGARLGLDAEQVRELDAECREILTALVDKYLTQ
jgi:phage terminase Nu1 subunit (DNA packaging protein)